MTRYEKLDGTVPGFGIPMNTKLIEESIFTEKPFAKALILEENETPIGVVTYFHNPYRMRFFVHDLFIQEKYRGKGYGSKVFNYLCQEAKNLGYIEFEWWCLNWNKPSIGFYKNKLGAKTMTDCTVF